MVQGSGFIVQGLGYWFMTYPMPMNEAALRLALLISPLFGGSRRPALGYRFGVYGLGFGFCSLGFRV